MSPHRSFGRSRPWSGAPHLLDTNAIGQPVISVSPATRSVMTSVSSSIPSGGVTPIAVSLSHVCAYGGCNRLRAGRIPASARVASLLYVQNEAQTEKMIMISHQCTAVYQADPLAGAYGLGAVSFRLQAMGYAVLGLGRYSKRPHHLYGDRGGVYWASADPAAAAWLWGRDRLAGIGVATGTRSRLAVADLDMKHGEDGIAAWRQQFGGWPGPSCNYPVVSTPGGGYHIWMRLPAGITCPGRTGILPGVDIKGEGGYVAAPPTMVLAESAAQDGGRALLPYRWYQGCPCTVPDAPPWLLAWIA